MAAPPIILGCRARNQPAQPPAGDRLPPFDHKTGEGHVPFHGGDYHDARYKKRNQVVPLIVEALGGIGRRGARCLRFLARRASCRKRGRDGTTYSRFHPSNYLSHHLAGIVTAAVFSDAAHIVEEIALLKTRTSGATRTRGPRRRLTLSSERAARSPTPVNPAGFEPRIPRVPDSGPVVPCVSFPRLTCELVETKVPSPLGAAPAKDQCQHVGHLVAFGNTEEWLHRQILGCRARNQPAQPPAGGRLPPFDHKTGEGHVPFHGGDYHDARYKKRNQVVPLIVEALGGIGRRGARCLRFLARRASCRKRGRDGTTYSRFHPSNYLSHHLAGIVTAAVFSDAAHIVEEIALLKTRTSGATRTAAAANPIE